MRKILAVLFGLVLTLGLTACGEDKVDSTTSVANARAVALKTVGQSGEAAKLPVDVVGTVSAVVMGYYNDEISEKGYYVTDKTGTIYVHDYNSAPLVAVGDSVKLEAIATNYNGGLQLTAATVAETYSKGNAISFDAMIKGKSLADLKIEGLTGDALTAKITEFAGNMYEITGTVEQDEENGSYSLRTEDGYIGVYASGTKGGCPTNAYDEILKSKVGQEVTVAFVINGTNYNKTALRGNVVKVIK